MYDVEDGGQEPTEPNNLILNLTGDLQEPPKMPTLVVDFNGKLAEDPA